MHKTDTELTYNSSASDSEEGIIVIVVRNKNEFSSNENNTGGNADYLVRSVSTGEEFFCRHSELE